MDKLKFILEMGAWADSKLTRQEVRELESQLRPVLLRYADAYYLVGSYRRGKSVIGDLDILVVNGQLDAMKDKLFKQADIVRCGQSVLTIVTDYNGRKIQVEVSNTTKGSLGAALLHHTGSSQFNIGLRSVAKKKEFTLNQYGLYDKSGKKIAGKSEEEIFNALGYKFIPPSDRNGNFWDVKDKYKLR